MNVIGVIMQCGNFRQLYRNNSIHPEDKSFVCMDPKKSRSWQCLVGPICFCRRSIRNTAIQYNAASLVLLMHLLFMHHLQMTSTFTIFSQETDYPYDQYDRVIDG